MTAAFPEVSIVVPVRDDERRLAGCLAALTSDPAARHCEIIVADNGSRDDSPGVARRAATTLLSLPGLTVAAMRNEAAAQARGALLAFVDADHVVDTRWLSAARAIMADGTVAAAGAPYASPADANWVQRTYAAFRVPVTGQQDTDWLGSGNLVVRRKAFDEVGGFDTSLEACEDVDLCNRLRCAGYRLVADERLRSVHLGDPATLRAVFLGELWRGRNNLKVTLRGPLTLRAVPSLAFPVVNLVGIAALLASPMLGWRAAVGAAACYLAIVGLRTARMTAIRRGGLGQNIAVAAVYELARALALVTRATHRTRRQTAGARAIA